MGCPGDPSERKDPSKEDFEVSIDTWVFTQKFIPFGFVKSKRVGPPLTSTDIEEGSGLPSAGR